MANELRDLIATVDDEKSFLRFLEALRKDSETPHNCYSYQECAMADHWETKLTKDFLKGAAEWGTGDFADGVHHGEPILRRVATMLYVGRYFVPEDRPR